jgi:hypothetical protein
MLGCSGRNTFKEGAVWRNRKKREVITFRNFKERGCATVAEGYRVLSPFPSLRVLLGYAVIAWLRKDDVTSVTSSTNIHNAALFACQIPALIGETEGSAGSVEVEVRLVQLQYELLVVSRPVMYEWNSGVLEEQHQLGTSLVHVRSQ